jgi:heat shock protein HslJ
MKYKPYLYAIAVLILLLCIIWVWWLEPTPPTVSITPAEAEKLTKATIIKYANAAGEELTVAYAVQVTGLGYTEATLRQVPAASGVKYEADDGLVFHSKGDDVILETAQTQLFMGQEVGSVEILSPSIPEEFVVPTSVDATSTATTTASIVGTWRYVSGSNADSAIALVNENEYALTFAGDGSVSGDTDCNGFGGTYTATDATLTFSDFMSTLMYCEGSSEQTFTAFFGGQTLTIDTLTDTTLTLSTDTLTLQFAR